GPYASDRQPRCAGRTARARVSARRLAPGFTSLLSPNSWGVDRIEEVLHGEFDLVHCLAHPRYAEPGMVREVERLGRRLTRLHHLRRVQRSRGRAPRWARLSDVTARSARRPR